MTPERKNEIWRELPKDFKSTILNLYNGYKTYCRTSNETVRDIIEIIFGSHNLTEQAEENAKAKDFPILSDSLQASGDWNSYRLELTKEIAIAMIGAYYNNIPDTAVGIANEIVKRLKETEE